VQRASPWLKASWWLGAAILVSNPIFSQGVSTSVGGLTTTPTRVGPSSVFWNPATLGPTKGTMIESNLALVGGWLIYDREGTNPQTNQNFDSSQVRVLAPNPYLSISSDFGLENWRFGYSTYFPTGGFASYPTKGSQRYELIQGLYIPWNQQLTVAYSPTPEWSLGAGFIYSLGFFKAKFDIDMAKVLSQMTEGSTVPKESVSLNSPTRIPLSIAHGFTGNFGILYRPNVQWSAGFSVVLPMEHVFTQRMEMQRPNGFQTLETALASLGLEKQFNHRASFRFRMPLLFNLGIRFQPYGYYTGEYYGRYALSSQTPFASVKFEDSSLAALEDAVIPGAKAEDSFSLGTVQTFDLWRPVQAGLMGSYSSAGVPEQSVSPSRLGFNIFTLGIFARFKISPRFRMTGEYAHSFIQTRVVRNAKDPKGSITLYDKPNGNGEYRAGMDRAGLSLSYEF